MIVTLIRHGMTKGNSEKRYVGTSDEDLCEQGREALIQLASQKKYPKADLLFVSPMKRCRQTAEILYPGLPQHVIPEIAECDFGDFEGKNYIELAEDPEYQKWIEEGGLIGFPGGESLKDFRNRCVAGFHKLLQEVEEIQSKAKAEGQEAHINIEEVSCVAHGGTMMAILSALDVEAKDYFAYQSGNGAFYRCEVLGDGNSQVQLNIIEHQEWQEN